MRTYFLAVVWYFCSQAVAAELVVLFVVIAAAAEKNKSTPSTFTLPVKFQSCAH